MSQLPSFVLSFGYPGIQIVFLIKPESLLIQPIIKCEETLKLSSKDVIRIAEQCGVHPPCNVCSIFVSVGWDSFPSMFNDSGLTKIGSLWLADEDEPTLDEFHPDKTNYWSASAPIALEFHPYNRCELWQCRVCRYPFLRYTEYGGYYEDRRIRALNPKLIV